MAGSGLALLKLTRRPGPEQREEAASVLQAGYRGQEEEQEEAATVLQAGYREQQEQEMQREREQAVSTLQAGYRQTTDQQSGRQQAVAPPQDNLGRDQAEAATVLQAGFRERKLSQENTIINYAKNGAAAEVSAAATVLQEGVRKASRLQGEETVTSAEKDSLFSDWKIVDTDQAGEPVVLRTRESSGRVERVGAVPFYLHEAAMPDLPLGNEKEVCGDRAESEDQLILAVEREASLVKTRAEAVGDDIDAIKANLVERFTPETAVEVFLRAANAEPECEAVLLYLLERGIPHTVTRLTHAETVQDWFLALSPASQTPVLRYNKEDVISGFLRIVAFLERKIPDDLYPMLTPPTSNQKLHQKFILYSSLLDRINLAALILGCGPSESSGPGNLTDVQLLRNSLLDRKEQLEQLEGEL